jgi:hypothetical protein
MRIVHADDVPYKKPRTNHREGDIEFKRVMQGTPGSVQNYEFLIAKTGGRFFGPRHRHNFEQIRLGLSGTLGKGKADTIAPGQIGYYPENCYYQIDSSDSEIVLLQFAGPSGWGFLSYDQLYAGSAELAKLGTFEDGVFFRNPGTNLAPGQKKNQDGYEAIWEHVYGRPIEYPKPRYEAPVLMNPDNYPWMPEAGAPGVARRHIASFSERRIEIAQIRLDAGARTAETAPAAPRFLFVTEGTGAVGGMPVRKHSLVELATGESAGIAADEALVLLTISMPAFSAEEIAFFEERNRRKTSAAA